jgi:hypothetical protein
MTRGAGPARHPGPSLQSADEGAVRSVHVTCLISVRLLASGFRPVRGAGEQREKKQGNKSHSGKPDEPPQSGILHYSPCLSFALKKAEGIGQPRTRAFLAGVRRCQWGIRRSTGYGPLFSCINYTPWLFQSSRTCGHHVTHIIKIISINHFMQLCSRLFIPRWGAFGESPSTCMLLWA